MTPGTMLAESEARARWFLDTFLCFGLGVDRPFDQADVTFVETSEHEGFAQVTFTFPSGETYHVEVTAVE